MEEFSAVLHRTTGVSPPVHGHHVANRYEKPPFLNFSDIVQEMGGGLSKARSFSLSTEIARETIRRPLQPLRAKAARGRQRPTGISLWHLASSAS